jgi:hypothetical protein
MVTAESRDSGGREGVGRFGVEPIACRTDTVAGFGMRADQDQRLIAEATGRYRRELSFIHRVTHLSLKPMLINMAGTPAADGSSIGSIHASRTSANSQGICSMPFLEMQRKR